MKKAILGGIITICLFYVVNMFILQLFLQFLFPGDGFIISYHMFSYTGAMLLGGIIVACTILILDKLSK